MFTCLSKYGKDFVTTIMNALQYAFARRMKYNIPVFQIAVSDNMEKYVTTKKDVLDGNDRLPTELSRTLDVNRYK